MDRAEGQLKLASAKGLLLDVEEEAEEPLQVLYSASFEELSSKNVQYDTIIWLSISLVLVLACGIGVLMLLYLPFRRYVLQKDIASRKLYVTSKEIVYKVHRPSFIPFCGGRRYEKHVPLSMVIDVIIEQGCLQAVYGLHTLRVDSISHGKAAPVDELQVQGIHSPGLLRKVVVTQASKVMQDVGGSWNSNFQTAGSGNTSPMQSFTLGPAILASPSKGWKPLGSPLQAPSGSRVSVPTDLMLQKLEEVNKSVKRIEFLVEKSEAATQPSSDNSVRRKLLSTLNLTEKGDDSST